MIKVAFHTLGCKLNFAETSSIARQFYNAGYKKVEFNESADIYLINTCTVTENADRECRTIVKRALSASPHAFVIVTGCFAQLKPQNVAAIDGVDLVLGANEKFDVLKYIERSRHEQSKIFACETATLHTFHPAFSAGDRTRAFLKVQDGCNYNCSFCTIPLARGKSRSDTIANAVGNARALGESGIREIVLSGVNLGDFGNRGSGENFLQLITALDKVSEVERFRISSIEPNLLTDEIIEFVASSKKFMPHFHIPLQSGADKTLGAMRRRYRSDLYRQRVDKIKSLLPYCAIGVDVITGFPGETEQDFQQSYNFIESLPVSYLHVFTYSERENTLAATMPGAVALQVRKSRNMVLRNLSRKKQEQFYNQSKFETAEILFEGENKNGFMFGYSKNYIRAKMHFDVIFVNKVVPVSFTELDDDLVFSCSAGINAFA